MNHTVPGTVYELIFIRAGCAYGAYCAASRKAPELMRCTGPGKQRKDYGFPKMVRAVQPTVSI